MIDRHLFDKGGSVAFEIPPFKYLIKKSTDLSMFSFSLLVSISTRMSPEINDDVPVNAT